MFKKLLIPFFLCLFHDLFAQAWFTTGQNADLMVSGVDFNHSGGAFYYNHPSGLATDGAHFLLCDRFNNRVLVWNSLPVSWDAAPDFVLGQPDFVSNNPGSGKNQLNWAGNVSVTSNGKLAIADTENDRILLWNTFPTANAQPADVSLFLPSMTPPGAGIFYGWPWGVWTDGTRVAAVATSGGALLFWNSFPTIDNTPPDYTIKLPQFGTPRNISTDGSTYFFVGDHNAKVNNGPGTFFWNAYPTSADQPWDFYRDEWIKGEKTAGGALIAGGLSSIYRWNTMPTSGNQNPDLTLTPAAYKNGDGVDLAIAGNTLFVNNYNGNNVLIFNNLPTASNYAPDFALGSPSITAQTLDSIYYVQNPVPVTDGQRLIVTSDFDRAIYVWNQFPAHSGQPYDHRISMPPNVHLWATALHNDTFAIGARNTLSVWDDASQLSGTPSRIFVNNIGAALLDDIRGLAMDDQFFYLATKSGKIYVWQGVPVNADQNPVLTLNSSNGGQFAFLNSDGEYLCAARPEPPTGVDIYRVADLAMGITTPYKIVGSAQLRINQASHAVTFDGSIAIASRGDHSVLLWKDPADWGNPSKTIVLGQPATNTYEAGIGLNHLFMPNALLHHGNDLWVGEFKFSSRILKFSAGTSDAPEVERPQLTARLYPNPVVDQFTLEFVTPEEDACRITLLDAYGKSLAALCSQELAAGEKLSKTFSASTLALQHGVYFVRIEMAKSRGVVRFVY